MRLCLDVRFANSFPRSCFSYCKWYSETISNGANFVMFKINFLMHWWQQPIFQILEYRVFENLTIRHFTIWFAQPTHIFCFICAASVTKINSNHNPKRMYSWTYLRTITWTAIGLLGWSVFALINSKFKLSGSLDHLNALILHKCIPNIKPKIWMQYHHPF